MLYSAHQLADYWARQPGGDPFADVRERAIRFYDTVMHLSQPTAEPRRRVQGPAQGAAT